MTPTPRPSLLATRAVRFSAAHSSAEASGHGHDYTVEVSVGGPVRERDGMIMNLSDLKAILQEEVVDRLHRRFLNRDVDHFADRHPTAENLIRFLWDRIEPRLPHPVELVRLRLIPSDDRVVTRTRERAAMIDVTRQYDFCASHRLHNPDLSDEENVQIYGKCNHVHGHGHNYDLEVTVTGQPDPRLGTVVPVAELDRVVTETILDRLDHRNLNIDIEELQAVIPTTENIVRFIWNRLVPEIRSLGVELRRIVLAETKRNRFEYTGETA